jgi:magnesium transporter
MISDLDHFEQMLSRSHSNFLVRLSNDGIGALNRTVTVLGMMAFIGGIVMAGSNICRLFGMNVPVPGAIAMACIGASASSV